MRRQAFLRVLKFFEKRHIVFPHILSEAAVKRCSIVNNLEKFRDVYIQTSVLSKFETNQGFTILKKHQQELN